jgi:hypothetical protein
MDPPPDPTQCSPQQRKPASEKLDPAMSSCAGEFGAIVAEFLGDEDMEWFSTIPAICPDGK